MRNATVVVSGATDSSVSSAWFYVGNMTKISVISNVSGDVAAAGTINLNVSNEPSSGGGSMMPFTPTISKTLTSPAITVSGNGTLITSVTDICYQWMQIAYTRSAGSGGVLTIHLASHD